MTIQIIEGRARDLGGFSVRRVLPSPARRAIGPFVFFDHMGPADFAPGSGVNVRPHPHINLATMTYLFEGEIVHRDSTGVTQAIAPNEVNWMVAGRGIVHSERTAPEREASGGRVHGLQVWLGLPTGDEETEPAFYHFDDDELPRHVIDDVVVRVVAGTAYGKTSPVPVFSPLFYLGVELASGQRLPLPDGHVERAVYVATGAVRCGGQRVEGPAMIIIDEQGAAEVVADAPSKLVALGGQPLDGRRHLWWNFVSSSTERIEQARRDWRERRFPPVPGDDEEFIPLPDEEL